LAQGFPALETAIPLPMAGPGNGVVVLEAEPDDRIPSDEEIREYAEFLGIDLEAEPYLMWIAQEGVAAPVPPPWKACTQNGDDVFYFNFETSESSWEHPCDEKYRNLVEVEKRKHANPDAAAGGLSPTNDSSRTPQDRKCAADGDAACGASGLTDGDAACGGSNLPGGAATADGGGSTASNAPAVAQVTRQASEESGLSAASSVPSDLGATGTTAGHQSGGEETSGEQRPAKALDSSRHGAGLAPLVRPLPAEIVAGELPERSEVQTPEMNKDAPIGRRLRQAHADASPPDSPSPSQGSPSGSPHNLSGSEPKLEPSGWSGLVGRALAAKEREANKDSTADDTDLGGGAAARHAAGAGARAPAAKAADAGADEEISARAAAGLPAKFGGDAPVRQGSKGRVQAQVDSLRRVVAAMKEIRGKQREMLRLLQTGL